ncbi:MAG TPA: filamentous hemagglutinin N-terminal domain-containing protein, partial [Candidatus Kapabacteria bacterium]|nr:filamentous hemagglutinin N-terminal domain-containing protein [Candidatus Kapabacteria bacterium]
MKMVKQGLTITLIALQVWQPVLAGVVASNPQITQDQAANGVPVVNIATPGQSGISHNTYTRFDVDRQGLILNNSGQPVNTQLGGFIPGNANLHSGSARLILNEVSGNLPSQLKGYMEIAGQKAEMIIANPAGITCDGCGFINTSRGTLTTGKPLFGSDGSLNGFRVEDGMLAIDGLGLNASNTDRLNLYSRALVLNAELHARDVNVMTGTNDINVVNGVVTPTASGSTTPTFSIDSSSLGGMYANRIRLVGTEAGVGMRLAAPVAAMNGNLEITSNGDVRLVRASATQRVDVRAEGNVAIDSDGAGDRDGISSGAGTTLRATGAVTLASGADITGTVIGLMADSVDTENDSDIAARGALVIDAANMQLAGTIASRQTITLTGNTLANQGQMAANTGLTITASSLDNSGRISSAGGNGRLTVAGELRNDGGIIQQAGTLDITAAGVSSINGAIAANGNLSIAATNTSVDNTGGLLQGNTGIFVRATGLVNSSGEVVSNGDIHLLLDDGAIDNRNGLIETLGNIDLLAKGLLQNSGGRFRSGADMTFTLDAFDRALAGGSFAADGLWKI